MPCITKAVCIAGSTFYDTLERARSMEEALKTQLRALEQQEQGSGTSDPSANSRGGHSRALSIDDGTSGSTGGGSGSGSGSNRSLTGKRGKRGKHARRLDVVVEEVLLFHIQCFLPLHPHHPLPNCVDLGGRKGCPTQDL